MKIHVALMGIREYKWSAHPQWVFLQSLLFIFHLFFFFKLLKSNISHGSDIPSHVAAKQNLLC